MNTDEHSRSGGAPSIDQFVARFPQFDTNNDGSLSREESVTSGGKNK